MTSVVDIMPAACRSTLYHKELNSLREDPDILGRRICEGTLNVLSLWGANKTYATCRCVLTDSTLLQFDQDGDNFIGEISLTNGHITVSGDTDFQLKDDEGNGALFGASSIAEVQLWIRGLSAVATLRSSNTTRKSIDDESAIQQEDALASCKAERPEKATDEVVCPLVRVQGDLFVDEQGRALQLRGVNLSGACKIPTTPNGATHLKDSLLETKHVSFVGRPFPLDECDEHYTRLKAWGMMHLRFLVTWEAIEHEGPGIYDMEYIAYVRQMLIRAKPYGFTIYIDPHQDVWSRWTGGDGAPGWIFEKLGMDTTKFQETGAAYLHQYYETPTQFPKMLWPTNYLKYACATMFTLFWTGDEFAPQCKIDDVPVQKYLQEHYIKALGALARELRDLPHIVGYGTMNEPSKGYFEYQHLNKLQTELMNGPLPTPFEGMALASGHCMQVGVYSPGFNANVLGRPNSRIVVNLESASVWVADRRCVWKEHGVWSTVQATGAPILLKPTYFQRPKIDWGRDIYLPFAQKYANHIREVCRPCWDPALNLPCVFIELPPSNFGGVPFPRITKEELPNAINAGHWYDGMTMFRGAFNENFTLDVLTKRPVLGFQKVRHQFVKEQKGFLHESHSHMGGVPTLIGECGIRFDLSGGKAFKTGDWKEQRKAMDTTVSALENNRLNFCLWNYCPLNTHDLGDLWNLEDFSVFSRAEQTQDAKKDQQAWKSNVHSGGRALRAFCRPYPLECNGRVLLSMFDMHSRLYVADLELFREQKSSRFFVPAKVQYPHGYKLWWSQPVKCQKTHFFGGTEYLSFQLSDAEQKEGNDSAETIQLYVAIWPAEMSLQKAFEKTRDHKMRACLNLGLVC